MLPEEGRLSPARKNKAPVKGHYKQHFYSAPQRPLIQRLLKQQYKIGAGVTYYI
jgi:hypothetical protein